MSEASEIFNELMFGAGAWFGLILILAVALSVSYHVKYSSPIFILILIFMGFNYLQAIGDQISITSNFVWASIIAFVGVAILAGMLIKDVSD